MDGILPLVKPVGVSSYDVIRLLKRRLPELRGKKIGHAGTLDPLAEGVLPLLVGEATKLFDFLLDRDKLYEVWIQLGAATDTDDAMGRVIRTSPKVPLPEEVDAAVARFRGRILQVPPRYSALKVDGKRAYERARNGEEVVMKPREVEIYAHEIVEYDREKRLLHSLVRCSSGTYIRSLARDIGEELGCYGHVVRLVRQKTLGISLSECVRVEDLSEATWRDVLLPMRRFVGLPVLEVQRPDGVRHGRPLGIQDFTSSPGEDGLYQVVWEESLLAIGEWKAGKFHYRRVFHA